MAEKELLNSEAEICGTVTLGYDRAGLFNPGLPHAAATTAKLATATQAAFLVASCKGPPSFFPGRIRPPCSRADLRAPQESRLAEPEKFDQSGVTSIPKPPRISVYAVAPADGVTAGGQA